MSLVYDTIRANESTDPMELAELANHTDSNIRAYVAENRCTPPEVLEKLSNDPDTRVIIYLLRNHKLPAHIFLKILTTIKDPLAKREACVLAVRLYRQGEMILQHDQLLAIVKTLDMKVDTLSLIEAVEKLHELHNDSTRKSL